MLENVVDALSLSLNVEDVLERLVTGLICGVLLAVFYRRSFRSTYVPGFVASLILLVVTTACVIMVIGDSLARAFGLAGAMSIIRFRTALKDTHDIMFVFIALTIGLAIGVGLYLIAFTGTLFIGMLAWVMKAVSSDREPGEFDLFDTLRPGRPRAAPPPPESIARLRFTYRPPPDPSEADGALADSPPGSAATLSEPPYQAVLDSFCSAVRLREIRTSGEESKKQDLSFRVVMDRADGPALMQALAAVPGVKDPEIAFRRPPKTPEPDDDSDDD